MIKNKNIEYRKKLYSVWRGMKNRCSDKKSKYYGGKGILVCDEWTNNFNKFYEWALINGYKEGLQIDRINCNGNYEPSNCRWVTPKENSNNKTNNKRYTINGTTKTYSEWAETIGISKCTFSQRIDNGWSGEELLNGCRERENIRKYSGQVLVINGVSKSFSEWCNVIGVSYATLSDRIEEGWSDNELLMPKGYRRKKKMAISKATTLIDIEGIKKPISEWCELININQTSFRRRMAKGISGKDLLLPSRYSKKEINKLYNEIDCILKRLRDSE